MMLPPRSFTLASVCFRGNPESNAKDSEEDLLNRSVSFSYLRGFLCIHFSNFIGQIRTVGRVVLLYRSKENLSDPLQRQIRFTARVVAKTLGNLFAFLQLFCSVQRFLRYLNRVYNPALLNRGF
jgi:hypothetical protein